jgi:hypothetical protein
MSKKAMINSRIMYGKMMTNKRNLRLVMILQGVGLKVGGEKLKVIEIRSKRGLKGLVVRNYQRDKADQVTVRNKEKGILKSVTKVKLPEMNRVNSYICLKN